ncbi:hypothetical protein RJ640_013428 [Escallonia rubra]|uniref:Agenet domain-containing protein n=1 Tax=Escallonia rubra TaxID=112253 RepID=A0AA88UDL7_9ASTE|nr:hypothetical protein RJ640_013428 [Escallonia rubra]
MDYFFNGADVEINGDKGAFRRAFYEGKVIRPPNSKRKRNLALVEYKTLRTTNNRTKPLVEELDVVNLRPPPPREHVRRFNISDSVDAYLYDGWWEGVVVRVLSREMYVVHFRALAQEIAFGPRELRPHREWVHGSWVPPYEDEEASSSTSAQSCIDTVDEMFSEGTTIEVTIDEDGFQGSWFAATVIELLGNSKFLIEYKNLRNDEDTELLKEVVDYSNIRPIPPETLAIDDFNWLEEVDAWYNEGWWVGAIEQVLEGQKYIVYFRGYDDVMEFKHSDLRLHQEWIFGKWVMPS